MVNFGDAYSAIIQILFEKPYSLQFPTFITYYLCLAPTGMQVCNLVRKLYAIVDLVFAVRDFVNNPERYVVICNYTEALLLTF